MIGNENNMNTISFLVFSLLFLVFLVKAENFDIQAAFKRLESNRDFLLEKSSFQPNRLVFVAGLEGTGHHAISSMFQICLRASVNKCIVDKKLTQLMYNTDNNSPRKGLFFAEDADNSVEHINNIRQRMKKLVNARGGLLFLVGLTFVHGAGMMSYPNFNKGMKAVNYPDVFLLAMLAESVGLDFRVLVLQRSARDILRSVQKRQFGGYRGTAVEPQIVVDSSAALITQLTLLENKFYQCVDYKDLGNMSTVQKDELISFVHPVVMGYHYNEMIKQVVYSSSSEHSNSTSSTNNGLGTGLDKFNNLITVTINNGSISNDMNNNGVPVISTRKSRSGVRSQTDPDAANAAVTFAYYERLLSDRLAILSTMCQH